MVEWLATIAALAVLLLLMWWAALILLALKYLLFVLPFTETPRPAPADTLLPEEEEHDLGEAAVLPRACLWGIVFLFWPMAVGQLINTWLTNRHR
jgi:hypothetical protein